MLPRFLAALSLLLAAIPVHAENRLFPTDVLNAGEIDAMASVADTRSKFDGNSFGNPGRFSSHVTEEALGARYGLGNGWHVGVVVPYYSKYVSHSRYSAPPVHFENDSLEGKANPQLTAKYSFIGDGTRRFSLAGELGVSPNTSGKSPTSFMGRIAAGWKTDETLRLFATYTGTRQDGSDTSDTDLLTAGAYKAVSDRVTLIPKISYAWIGTNDDYSRQSFVSLGIAAQIQLAKRTYVRPEVSQHRYSSRHRKDGALDLDASHSGHQVGVAIYHLF